MNIFENLLDELKEENLLEKTVIETKKSAGENETGGEKSGVENLNSRKEKNGY
ncbi:MAG: hypothetical protein M3525_04940 [Acidobacteriota bacterium]|nr:hypothetical protein [Acidobacteriota bacterium]